MESIFYTDKEGEYITIGDVDKSEGGGWFASVFPLFENGKVNEDGEMSQSFWPTKRQAKASVLRSYKMALCACKLK